MTALVIDSGTRDRFLAAAGDVVELRDEAGNLLGWAIHSVQPPPVAGFQIEGNGGPTAGDGRQNGLGRTYSSDEVMAFLAGIRRALR